MSLLILLVLYKFPTLAAFSQSPKAGFPNSNITDILGKIFLCCRNYSRHCRIFSTNCSPLTKLKQGSPSCNKEKMSPDTDKYSPGGKIISSGDNHWPQPTLILTNLWIFPNVFTSISSLYWLIKRNQIVFRHKPLFTL